MDDSSGVYVHDEECENGLKHQVSNLDEVTSPNLPGVVVDEVVPFLSGV
jgi:hypothetical protein